jgi:hypothetical protein
VAAVPRLAHGACDAEEGVLSTGLLEVRYRKQQKRGGGYSEEKPIKKV